MARFLTCEAEVDALLGCSLEARSLYSYAIRPKMDYRTGFVGRSSKVSVSRLGLSVAYYPDYGSQRAAWEPTLRKTEILIDELERHGLVHRVSKEDRLPSERGFLILFLPLAECVETAQEQAKNAPEIRKIYPKRERGAIEVGTQSKKTETNHKVSCFQATAKTTTERNISGIQVDQVKTNTHHHLSNYVAPAREKRSNHDDDLLIDNSQTPKPTETRPQLQTPSVLDRPELKPFSSVLSEYGWSASKILKDLDILHDKIKKGMGTLALQTACEIAKERGAKTVKYVLSCVDTVMQSRNRNASPRGYGRESASVENTPYNSKPWHMSASGVEDKGRELGIFQKPDEAFPWFKQRVFEAAGLTRAEQRKDHIDFSGAAT